MQTAVYFSYWVPYTYTRHQDMIARLQMNDKVELEVVGSSLDGRDLDLLIIGQPPVCVSVLDLI